MKNKKKKKRMSTKKKKKVTKRTYETDSPDDRPIGLVGLFSDGWNIRID